ncbi:hypothetical protein M3629_07965 [Paenibacillus polysaccharolyticus]|nr:hypothetical protein [Paenibacillus polysaccharolyticus]
MILTGFDAQSPKESFITFIKDWFAQVDPSKASGFAQTEHWYLKMNTITDMDEFNKQKKKIKEKYLALQKS